MRLTNVCACVTAGDSTVPAMATAQLLHRLPHAAASATVSAFGAGEWGECGRPMGDQAPTPLAQSAPARASAPLMGSGGLSAAFASRGMQGATRHMLFPMLAPKPGALSRAALGTHSTAACANCLALASATTVRTALYRWHRLRSIFAW